jgi:hypothetical protein
VGHKAGALRQQGDFNYVEKLINNGKFDSVADVAAYGIKRVYNLTGKWNLKKYK